MATKAARGIVERMFARKSIAQVQRETAASELKRTLGKWNLLMLGIGCIIGAGIFVRTGSAARWAYLAVVWTCVWPRSLPIIGNP